MRFARHFITLMAYIFFTQPAVFSMARISACPPFQVDKDEDEGCLIYAAANIANGKVYIGLSTTPLRVRRTGHLSRARARPTYPFSRAIAKYGQDAFAWYTVHSGLPDNQVLDDAEIYYIKTLMSRCNIPICRMVESSLSVSRRGSSSVKGCVCCRRRNRLNPCLGLFGVREDLAELLKLATKSRRPRMSP